MKTIGLIISLLAISGEARSQLFSPTPEERKLAKFEVCPRMPVPLDSHVRGDPNTGSPILIIHPRRLTANYSGCAYAWLGNDAELHTIARYKSGRVIDSVISDSILPSMVYCSLKTWEAHPHVCRSFAEFWSDASEQLAPDKTAR